MVLRGWFLLVLAASVFAAAAEQPFAPDWSALLTENEASEGFYPLYDGTLGGWVIRGPDKRAFLALGEVLAAADGGPGNWLTTVETYEHFVLRYAYRIAGEGGSAAVSVLAQPENGDTLAGVAIVPPAAAEKPAGEWNEVEVVSESGRVRALVNGAEVYDEPASARAGGHIAIGDCGGRIEFTRMRIKPLPGGSGWRKSEGPALTPPDATQFEMRLRFRPSRGAEGRLVFLDNSDTALFEVTLDNGTLEEFTGSIADKAPAIELRALDERWNHMRVAVSERNIRVYVNGKTVSDLMVGWRVWRRLSRGEGKLQFVLNSGNILFEDIEVRPIMRGAAS